MKKGKVKEKETKNKADMRRIPEGYVLCESGFPSLEELTKKSEAAHKLGYITINDLICVLASDDIYKKEELSAYWDSLQINKRKKFPNNIAMFEKRVSVGFLFEKMTSKSVNGSRKVKPFIGLTGTNLNRDRLLGRPCLCTNRTITKRKYHTTSFTIPKDNSNRRKQYYLIHIKKYLKPKKL